jgi:hypothetical protein
MAKPISEEHGRIAHQERGAQLQGDSEGRLDADRFTWLSIDPSLLGASRLEVAQRDVGAPPGAINV